MTVKVVVVLGFCLSLGIPCVSPANWWNVFSGFLKFGTVPTMVEGQKRAGISCTGGGTASGR